PDRRAHPVSLVNTADNVSDKRRQRAYRRRRGKRYASRAALRRVTKQDRLRACGARPVSRDGVLLRANTHGHAHYAGVQTCGSPWICPVCGPKIRQQRASEIVLAVQAHLAEGGQLYTSMFTFPHDLGDDLAKAWNTLRDGFRACISGRAWVKDRQRFGIIGYIRSTEITYGENGWHPHAHILWFFKGSLDQNAEQEFRACLYGRWTRFVEKCGFRSPRSDLMKLSPVRHPTEISDYLVKTGFCGDDGANVPRQVGLEMARHDLKKGRQKGRTPMQMVQDYLDDPVGRVKDLALWYSFEEVSKGKRSIDWSRDYSVEPTLKPGNKRRSRPSLKARFNLLERTDEELAEEAVSGADLHQLSYTEWGLVTAIERQHVLLEVAEDFGKAGVLFYLGFLVEHFQDTGDLSGVEALDRQLRTAGLVTGAGCG
ncbi:MAG: hypothetical protein ACE1Y4_08215, partial [Lysobacterales bacterium]